MQTIVFCLQIFLVKNFHIGFAIEEFHGDLKHIENHPQQSRDIGFDFYGLLSHKVVESEILVLFLNGFPCSFVQSGIW